MRKRVFASILAAVLVIGSFAGCGKGDEKGGSSSKGEKVFNYRVDAAVVGLNPIMNTTAADYAAHEMICDPLVRNVSDENNKNKIIPAAAESWEVSEDGLTWTFSIHKNAKWSDGTPLTAKDFEYTLKLMADPETAAVSAWLYDGVIVNFGEALYNKGKTPDDIQVKAIDDQTLEIKLVHPASYLLELVSTLYPVKQDKYEEWGETYGSSADKIVCSGPFTVESWNQNTELVVVKNENYWDADNVKLDKIVQKVIPETATAVQAFINGEIDAVETNDVNWVKTIEEADMANMRTIPDSAPNFMMFNQANEYLSNTKIRQALALAVDRDEFIEAIYNGEMTPLYSIMPDTMNVGDTPYTELVDGKNYIVKDLIKENPDPKKLLEEGLKELGKSTDASQVTLHYASFGTSESAKKICEWHKQNWEEKLGINVQIDMMEWNIMWEKIDAGDYEIASGGWGPYYNEPSALLSLFEPVNGYLNAEKTGWTSEESKEYSALCDKAKNIVDDKEKAQVYLETEEILLRNVVIAPISIKNEPTFSAKYVKDYIVGTQGGIDWAKVDIEK